MSLWIDHLVKPSPTNQPPTRREILRNDLAVGLTVLFALFLAIGIRGQVERASKTVDLGIDLPQIAYPERWMVRQTDDRLFRAVNPGSPSTFDARIEVAARPVSPTETLERARAAWALQLAATLQGYRELAADNVTVLGEEPALMTTYAYIADPTRASGANGLPVVVQARDIQFFMGDQLIVVTTATDATEWETVQGEFQILYDSLGIKPVEANLTIANPTPTHTIPAPTEANTGGFQGSGQDEVPAEGGD